jgi:hypothetical protein
VTFEREEDAMSTRTYCAVSALVFTLVAVAHLLRAWNGWPLLVGSWQVPASISWVAALVAAGIAVWGLRLAARER